MTNTLENLPDAAPEPPRGPEDAVAPNPADALETGVVWSRFAMLIAFFIFVVVVGGPNAIAFVIAIVAALVIHEGGHYLAGRWSGMLVTEYFIGVGPRIFSFRKGETVYGLKAIPLGAYVRIVGMNNLETVDPVHEPRTYRAAAWHKRVITILAGPATHFVIALVLMAVYLAGQGRPITDDPDAWAIGSVVEGTVAEQAGLEIADQVVAVGGVEIGPFEDLSDVITQVAGQETELTILRDGETQIVDLRVGDRLNQFGAEGLNGLYFGDIIRTFEGQPVANYAEFAALARERIGEQVTVGVQARGELFDQLVDIERLVENDADAVSGFLGVTRGQAFEPQSAGQAIVNSPAEIGNLISEIASRTPRLVTSVDGLRSLFGLTAFDATEESAAEFDRDGRIIEFRPTDNTNFDQERPISLLGLTILASALENGFFVLFLVIVLNLFFGLFNLVPLLPLDGGHIALATYEKFRSILSGGKEYAADAAKLLPVTYAVFGLLMVVSVIAIVRDVFDFVLPT